MSVEILRGVRANVGYWRDTNNRGDRPTGRLTLGGFASNLAGSGFDVTITDSRIDGPTGTYSSLYLSVGRQLRRSTYLSGDYSSSVSVVKFERLDGLFVETGPRTRRFTGSGVIDLNRYLSLLVTGEHMRDDAVSELRVLAGVTYRFQ